MKKIALICTSYIDKYTNKTELQLKKIKYGIEILIVNISKFIIIILVSHLLKVVPYTLIMMASFGLIRKSAFGLHFKNSTVCTIVSTLSFLFGVYISKHYPFNVKFTIFIFLITTGLFLIYAPSDTDTRPLIGKKFRYKLKRNTIITNLLILVIILILNDGIMRTLITLGVIMECILILPITYRILGKGYNNYEKYR